MKNIITLLASIGVGLSALAAEGGDKVTFVAKTTEAGTLLEVVGDRFSDTDSLVVEGPVNVADFKTMLLMTREGNTSVINLEKADVEEREIPEHAFYSSPYTEPQNKPSKLTHIILGPSIEKIGRGAFEYCYGLENITFYEQSLKELDSYMFYRCNSLGVYEPFVLPEGLEIIPSKAFRSAGCYGLGSSELVLPSTIKRLESEALDGTFFNKVNIPESIEYVGACAFRDTEIEEIIFAPDQKVEFAEDPKMYDGTFTNNYYLKKLYLPDCVKEIPARFASECDNLEDLRLPEDVEVIGSGAFENCDCLKYLILPDKLLRIEDKAFDCYRGGSNLIIPASVQYLGLKSFAKYSYEGGKVVCPGSIPAVCATDGEIGPFGEAVDCAMLTLVVPEGSGDSYRAAPGWSSFGTIEEVSQDVLGELLGVEAVEAAVSDVIVSAANGEIAVSGGAGEMCEVYTADGGMAASVRLSGDTRVALPQGLYIVKAAGKVCKVRI